LMAKLSSDTRFCFLTEADPAAAVTRLNDLLCEHTTQMDRFVTLCAVVLDPSGHTATLVSAGHPSPLLLRRAGNTLTEAMPREVPGVPLGMLEGHQYSSCQVSLQPDDCLIFFTDGVLDAVNVRNAPFGVKGLHAVIEAAGEASARPMGERIMKAVTAHAAGRP